MSLRVTPRSELPEEPNASSGGMAMVSIVPAFLPDTALTSPGSWVGSFRYIGPALLAKVSASVLPVRPSTAT